MPIGIDGIGVVGGFGCGLAALEKALEKGCSPAKRQPMPTVYGEIRTPMLLADTAELTEMIDRRNLRRADHHTRMALLACLHALADAGIEAPATESLGIIVATGYGSTCNTFDIRELCPEADIRTFSPIRFSNSVHNAAGARISTVLGARGPNLSVNQFDLSIPMAFLTAGHWLAEGRVERVLVGGVDDFARIMAYHRHRRVAESRSEADRRMPAPVGEGSAFFLLSARNDVAFAYGEVHEVSSGSALGPLPQISEEVLCLLGADGLSPGEEAYGRCVRGPAAAYAHLYGHLPVAMGFDIAAAAVGLRAGMIYGSAEGGVPLPAGPELISTSRPLAPSPICCLKFGAAGGWGKVVLGPAPERHPPGPV